MRIALVRPFNKFSYSITPPLGLGYLASMLKIKGGHDVLLYEAARDRLSKIELFYKFLIEIKPQVVGIQVYSVDLELAKEYLRCVKEVDKEIFTVMGGPHPSSLPEETMNYFGSDLDFIIAGEGEHSFFSLVNHIEGKKDCYSEIPGLVWRDKEKHIFKNKKEFIEDLDNLPWPDWRLLDLASYPHAPIGALSKRFPIAPILVSRGCPMSCNFCAAKTIYGNGFRYRNIDNVIAEIRYLKYELGINEIMILDDNFTFKKEIVLDFCNNVRHLNIDWNCLNGIRLDSIDDEIAEAMKNAGCHVVAIGIESGSQKILDDMGKRLNIERIVEKTNILRKHKIRMVGQFIIGYPTETREDVLKTIEFAKKLPIERAAFASFVPLPGSKIYFELNQKIRFYNLNFAAMSYYKVVESFTPYISKEELDSLLKWGIRSFHLRPAVLLQNLRGVGSFSNLYNLLKRFLKNYI